MKGKWVKEEEKRVDEKEVVRLIKEQKSKKMEISALKIELETAKRRHVVQFEQLEEEAKGAKAELTHMVHEYKQQIEELKNKVKFLSLLDKQCIACYTIREIRTRPRSFSYKTKLKYCFTHAYGVVLYSEIQNQIFSLVTCTVKLLLLVVLRRDNILIFVGKLH